MHASYQIAQTKHILKFSNACNKDRDLNPNLNIDTTIIQRIQVIKMHNLAYSYIKCMQSLFNGHFSIYSKP